MSAAFVASPASSEGVRDGFSSRMRQQQQQDAQSFLSADSPFEEIGLSPNSFVLVSPEESTHAHSSELGAEDWQLMPSPRNTYGVPFTTVDEAGLVQHHFVPAQYESRNLSVTSSLSSAAASASQYHSPMSESPNQPFRRQSPYHPAAQGQQQTFAESFSQWSTAAPMQTLTSSAPDNMFYSNVHHGMALLPPSQTLPSNAPSTQDQGPWSVHGPRLTSQVGADTVIFAPDYTFAPSAQPRYPPVQPNFYSRPDSLVSPGTHEPRSLDVAWPLPPRLSSDPHLHGIGGREALSTGPAYQFTSDPTFAFPHQSDWSFPGDEPHLPRGISVGVDSNDSSDVTDTRSKGNRSTGTDTVSQSRFSHQPSPMIKMEQQTPPLHEEVDHNIQFEEYIRPPHTQPGQHVGPIRSQTRRVGGRQVGSKFERAKAEQIKQRREDGACWTCSLQRDECSSGVICRRCERRMNRPNTEVILMCDRTKLQDLKGIFIPSILTSLYERKAVESFARVHIARWYKKAIQVPCKLIWGFEPVMVEMYEFEPKDEIIRHSLLGIDNHRMQQTQIEARRSPPLGLTMVDLPEVHFFNKEFDDIVDSWLDIFVERFYSKDEDDFAPRLLGLMANLAQSDVDEAKFLRDVFRLLVITYVLSHAVTIAESKRDQCLSQLQGSTIQTFPKHCGSKLANRQLKHLFSSIRDSLTDRILKQLSQFLKSSKRYTRWTSAFCAILGLAMAQEQGMQLVHLIATTEAKDGVWSENEAEHNGVKACAEIEDRFIFITKLFRIKYHAKFNPLREHEHEHIQEHLRPHQLEFVRSVAALCAEKGEYLRDRAHVRISSTNAIKYTARLVSQFLLSFWPPTEA